VIDHPTSIHPIFLAGKVENMATEDEKGKIFTQVMKKKKQPALIQTATSLFSATIHLHPDNRLSDELNSSEKFLSVTDARLLDSRQKVAAKYPYLAIQVSQIVWITPLGDSKEG
jgi:hypothetical protein